jgi:hypothetical protein
VDDLAGPLTPAETGVASGRPVPPPPAELVVTEHELPDGRYLLAYGRPAGDDGRRSRAPVSTNGAKGHGDA